MSEVLSAIYLAVPIPPRLPYISASELLPSQCFEAETCSEIVSYTDPSGAYPSFSSELRRRLPLRHLHWTSASRPVRTIDSLHVTLIEDNKTLDDNENGRAPKGESPRKERRHQIPGLRQTPYLKIYLLQCSDVDDYRANARKLLRDWVKYHTLRSQSSVSLNQQENHDAFEWLIIHLGPASTDGSRSRPSNAARSDLERKQSSSRWPSRSFSSVIEKIRADFNGTSKNAVDRVAQVHVAEPLEEDPDQARLQSQDELKDWPDLIAKMKNLILASFDLRVNQYEEDIKEKELQRDLPGWNFNTFFILKEGLSRGFESVGLVEDALTGYHELAAGLSAILDGQSDGNAAEQQAAILNGYSEDLVEMFMQAERYSKSTKKAWQETLHIVDIGARILNTDRKPFRDLILANKISSFDFQNYVFARQVSLLLSLAGVTTQPSSPRDGAISEGGRDAYRDVGIRFLNPSTEDQENLTILAEVAERASTFIGSMATALRNDIRSGIHRSDFGQNENDHFPSIVQNEVVENLVASWVFSASKCILQATSASPLSAQLDSLLRQLRSSVRQPSEANKSPVGPTVSTVHREGLPNRTSSLKAHASVLLQPPDQESFPSVTSLDAVRLLPPAASHPGTQELASQRGELLSLARRSLSSLGLRHLNRQGGLADVDLNLGADEGEMQDVRLENSTESKDKLLESSAVHPQDPIIAGVCNRNLVSALQSENDFYQAFEELTVSALANYVIGGRTKTAEAMTMDLGVTRFLLGDYGVAESYFRQLAQFYAKDDWSDSELLTLDLYAQCLHHVERNADYVRIAMKTLAKWVTAKGTIRQQSQMNSMKLANELRLLHKSTGSLNYILNVSKLLEEQVQLSMDSYFDQIDMGIYVHHSDDNDGFQFPLVLRSLLPESFLADSVRVQILSVERDQRSELWLHANDQTIETGESVLWLGANTMSPGWYFMNQVTLLCGNVVFVHSRSPPSDNRPFANSRCSTPSEFTNRRCLLLWPHFKSLEVRLSHSESTHLDQSKSIIVRISSGQNDISQGRLSLRAASAGLRLHTARAEVHNGEVAITDKTKAGSISFGLFHSNLTAKIIVPYSLESELKEIVVRAEVMYMTGQGEFAYACASKISTILPITINVRDTFKGNALFSTFTVGTANSVPVKVLKFTIEENEDYNATSQSLSSGGHIIFVRQPLSLISRICRTSQSRRDLDTNEALQRKMLLHVEYRCLDQEILTVAESVYSNALAATPLNKFCRLLVPAFLASLQSNLSNQQLETASLIGQIDIGTFEDYDWRPLILAGLPQDLGEELARWLMNWHNDHRTIPLKDSDQPSPIQILTVPFDLPHIHTLHTVRMRSLQNGAASSLQQDILTMGSVLPLEVVIMYTRKWWDGGRRSSHDGSIFKFKYEVNALADDWIVGGQKKGHFSAKAGEETRFAILLLPQRTGHLMFPSIDIRSLPSPRVSYQSNDPEEWAGSSISCEMDYQHYSRTILVVSDLSSTTVSIDPNSTHGS